MTVSVETAEGRGVQWGVGRAWPRRGIAAGMVLAMTAAVAGLASPSVHAQASRQPSISTVPYVTHAGDTLYDIAGRYMRDPHDWALLSRLNHVPAPRRMPAGIVLRLPADRLKQLAESARVIASSGPVDHAFGKNPYTPVTVGMVLGEGDRIRTGHSGFVTLELPDGSHVSVSQDGLLDIGTLRQTVLTGAADRVLDLRHGEVDSEVTHATQPDDRFQIRSPSVVAGVRGTRFRVAYDQGTQATAVEVLDGAVGVDPAGANAGANSDTNSDTYARKPGVPLQASAQLVKARFGSVTRAAGEIGSPVELLSAPTLVDPARVQDGKTVAFNLTAADRAVSYRVQIARDADQLDLIRDLRMSAPHADFGELADGTYFVRITAIDSNGLEGLPQVYGFERREFGLAASAAQRTGSRDYEFRWFVSRSSAAVETRFRFVLATSADLHDPIVDRTDLSGGQIIVSDLPRGVYYWTIVAEQFENGRFYEKSSSIRSFTLAR